MKRKRDFLHHVCAVDFDGTLCELAYPEIGEPRESVIRFVKYLRDTGWYIVLWTNREGALQEQALEWCKSRGIIFDTVNDNIPERAEYYGCNTRKVGCDLYIDDLMLSPDRIEKELLSDITLLNYYEDVRKRAKYSRNSSLVTMAKEDLSQALHSLTRNMKNIIENIQLFR